MTYERGRGARHPTKYDHLRHHDDTIISEKRHCLLPDMFSSFQRSCLVSQNSKVHMFYNIYDLKEVVEDNKEDRLRKKMEVEVIIVEEVK
ncbi:hypothetical protein RND71_008779 [Anisodus tanguticus]|uniref:Uncharacterized protein n=1 Tax=Anisodus tanguticus TaxID=243964 RepID=A0AAE1SNX9_9SOLA|nr:hypothetical protein RND71_008779 [Anisodus tanguticus]